MVSNSIEAVPRACGRLDDGTHRRRERERWKGRRRAGVEVSHLSHEVLIALREEEGLRCVKSASKNIWAESIMWRF